MPDMAESTFARSMGSDASAAIVVVIDDGQEGKWSSPRLWTMRDKGLGAQAAMEEAVEGADEGFGRL